ncbi:MAG: SDR family oxidoreductase [Candidatus Cloacimonetes bacterium]|nr:SDR family oxidoreductase [Candidatus Cloacimonadota bacterium]
MDEKRVAIITGVTRLKGIGRAICLELAKMGIDIFFTYWRNYDRTMPWGVKDDEPDLIQKEIIELGVRCEKAEIDLSEKLSTDNIFNRVETSLGFPSILINNATHSTMTNIENITARELDKHYFVNLRAPILLSSAFVRNFRNSHPGRIINISSGQSLSAMNTEIAYAVTKGAIETFTKTMQHELAYKNITINAINPGMTDSGWIDEDLSKIFINKFPKGRFGLPSDAAKIVGFLVSKDADWITGQIIHSEGGFIREGTVN